MTRYLQYVVNHVSINELVNSSNIFLFFLTNNCSKLSIEAMLANQRQQGTNGSKMITYRLQSKLMNDYYF